MNDCIHVDAKRIMLRNLACICWSVFVTPAPPTAVRADDRTEPRTTEAMLSWHKRDLDGEERRLVPQTQRT